MESREVHPGMTIRIGEDQRRPKLQGMLGTVQKSFGAPEYLAVNVLLETDDKSCSGPINSIQQSWTSRLPRYGSTMVVEGGVIRREECGLSAGYEGIELPFGYYLERDEDLLILHRADGTFVAVFGARGVDFFEVEATVWEDAD